MDRRTFLSSSGLALGTGPYLSRPARRTRFPGQAFGLGVASGDPSPDGMVLWTRLAPVPLHPDPATPGGMTPEAVPVRWEIAEDELFRTIAQRGDAIARPELGHSVHVEATGLRPGRDYFYRFRTDGEISPVGRTRTAPKPGVRKVTFGIVSCQNYEHGFFTGYRHLAEEDLDVILHLGDYIYEYGSGDHPAAGGDARSHGQAAALDLTGYRLRHAVYRTDPDLQAAHAAAPWIVSWDDHEVADNYLDQGDPEAFLRRRVAAYQAYYEHMPLRASSMPQGPDMRLYRRLGYGGLLDLHVLDTRQYRNAPPVRGGVLPAGPDREDPRRSILGDVQEAWLTDGLTRAEAPWQIIAQQVFLSQREFPPGDLFELDAWDGYPACRDRLLQTIAERHIRNPVVLTGDVHSNWVSELKADFNDPDSAVLGAELVGTSIASGGDGSDRHTDTRLILGSNPHLKFFDNHRGYVRCTVTPEHLRADYRVMPYVSDPGAPVHTRAGFQVDAGRPGVTKVLDSPLPGAPSVAAPTVEVGLEG